MAVTITEAIQLTATDGTGTIGDVRVTYDLSGGGTHYIFLEFKDQSGYWKTCTKLLGAFGAQSAANGKKIYWTSTKLDNNSVDAATQMRVADVT